MAYSAQAERGYDPYLEIGKKKKKYFQQEAMQVQSLTSRKLKEGCYLMNHRDSQNQAQQQLW